MSLLGLTECSTQHETAWECFHSWDDDVECTKCTVGFFLSGCTLLLAGVQCLVYFVGTGAKPSPQLALLGLCVSQLVLLVVHYGFYRKAMVFKLVQRYLHIVGLCVIAFFFSVLAHQQERTVVRFLLVPLLLVIAVFVTVVCLLILSVGARSVEEEDEAWMSLSVAYVVIAVAFALIGAHATWRLKHNAHSDQMGRRVRWIILVNCVAAVLAVLVDMGAVIHHAKHRHAPPKTNHYLALWIAHRVITDYVPVWGVLLLLASLPRYAFRRSLPLDLATPLHKASRADSQPVTPWVGCAPLPRDDVLDAMPMLTPSSVQSASSFF